MRFYISARPSEVPHPRCFVKSPASSGGIPSFIATRAIPGGDEIVGSKTKSIPGLMW